MKKFYKNLSIFLLLLIFILVVIDLLSMKEPWRTQLAEITDSKSFITGSYNGASEICPYIYKAQTNDGTTSLIIGDSICRQLFQNLQQYNPNISIIGSNGAITMAGQYIIANEYLKHHSNVTDIYLVLIPHSFYRTFDVTTAYQYTVMPFVQTGTISLLDNNTIESMEKVYGKIFLYPEVVNAIDKSAINRKLYFNALKKYSSDYVLNSSFELADQYVVKIQKLCDDRNIQFHLYLGPYSESKKDLVEKLSNEYKTTVLSQYFPDLFDTIHYYPAECFYDGTHFGGDYADQRYLNQVILDLFAETPLGRQLRFE